MKIILSAVMVIVAALAAGAKTTNAVQLNAGGNQMQVSFYSPTIVRIQKCPPQRTMPTTQSEVIIMQPKDDFDVSIKESNTAIRMSSDVLTVIINKRVAVAVNRMNIRIVGNKLHRSLLVTGYPVKN
jgi:hypothetical protein